MGLSWSLSENVFSPSGEQQFNSVQFHKKSGVSPIAVELLFLGASINMSFLSGCFKVFLFDVIQFCLYLL